MMQMTEDRTTWHRLRRRKDHLEVEWIRRASRKSKPWAWMESYSNGLPMGTRTYIAAPTFWVQGKRNPDTGSDLPDYLEARGWKNQDHLNTVPLLHHLHNIKGRHVYTKQGVLLDKLAKMLWQAYFWISQRVAYLASIFSLCQKPALPKELK